MKKVIINGVEYSYRLSCNLHHTYFYKLDGQKPKWNLGFWKSKTLVNNYVFMFEIYWFNIENPYYSQIEATAIVNRNFKIYEDAKDRSEEIEKGFIL